MDVQITAYTLGTSIPPLFFGAVASLGSIIQYIRTHQFPLRYFFIFLAGSCLVIIRSIFLAQIYGPFSFYNNSLNAIMAMKWFSQMFIPFLFCVFFEACRSILVSNTTKINQQNLNIKDEETAMLETNNNVNNTQNGTIATGQQKSNKDLFFFSYFAYFFTFVLIITNAVAAGLIVSSLTSYYSGMYESISGLEYFNMYGIWVYPLCAIIQLVKGASSLSRSVTSLAIYLIGVMIAIIGQTISNALFMHKVEVAMNDLSLNLVQVITVEIIGGVALVYASVWCSTRSWGSSSTTSKTVEPQRQ